MSKIMVRQEIRGFNYCELMTMKGKIENYGDWSLIAVVKNNVESISFTEKGLVILLNR